MIQVGFSWTTWAKPSKGSFGNPFSYHVFCQKHVLAKPCFLKVKNFANHVFFFFSLSNTKFEFCIFKKCFFAFLMGFQMGTESRWTNGFVVNRSWVNRFKLLCFGKKIIIIYHAPSPKHELDTWQWLHTYKACFTSMLGFTNRFQKE